MRRQLGFWDQEEGGQTRVMSVAVLICMRKACAAGEGMLGL